jgi:hypothetical protein
VLCSVDTSPDFTLSGSNTETSELENPADLRASTAEFGVGSAKIYSKSRPLFVHPLLLQEQVVYVVC